MPQQKKEAQEESPKQGEAQETQTQEAQAQAQEDAGNSQPASANPHINRNREISALLRASREERERVKLLAENRKLKAEVAAFKAQQSGGGDS